MDGSSPRVRGTLGRSSVRQDRARFIPACAGNASSSSSPRSSSAVHPRVCGERSSSDAEIGCEVGSSPRVRGTPTPQGPDFWWERFIPACAGNACTPGLRCPRRSVHPRVCGERACKLELPFIDRGSSPRVRGTPPRSPLPDGNLRFIPACAGNAPRAPGR